MVPHASLGTETNTYITAKGLLPRVEMKCSMARSLYFEDMLTCSAHLSNSFEHITRPDSGKKTDTGASPASGPGEEQCSWATNITEALGARGWLSIPKTTDQCVSWAGLVSFLKNGNHLKRAFLCWKHPLGTRSTHLIILLKEIMGSFSFQKCCLPNNLN